jgi:hypothetical protein
MAADRQPFSLSFHILRLASICKIMQGYGRLISLRLGTDDWPSV